MGLQFGARDIGSCDQKGALLREIIFGPVEAALGLTELGATMLMSEHIRYIS